jgi:hypothetical protein
MACPTEILVRSDAMKCAMCSMVSVSVINLSRSK